MIVALLAIASSVPGVEVAVGAELGPTLALPPFVFAHAGGFARVRLDSLVVRPEASIDATLFPVGLQTVDVCGQWAFDLADNIELAVGAGPAFGFVMTSVTDSSSPIRFIPGFGGVALGTLDFKVGEHLVWSVAARVLVSGAGFSHLGDGGVIAGSAMVGLAYQL